MFGFFLTYSQSFRAKKKDQPAGLHAVPRVSKQPLLLGPELRAEVLRLLEVPRCNIIAGDRCIIQTFSIVSQIFLSFTKFSKIKFDTFGQFSFRNIINFSLASSCYPTAAGPLRRLGLRLGRGLGAGRALLPLDLDLGRREARLGCKEGV